VNFKGVRYAIERDS